VALESASTNRIEDHAEPVGLMAVDDRILRIDVWPGSLTEALSGAKIGTSEQELTEYYGERLEATANSLTGGKTIVFTPPRPRGSYLSDLCSKLMPVVGWCSIGQVSFHRSPGLRDASKV
jgi:hypothetical protein